MSPKEYQNPLFDFLIPGFLDGKLTSVFNKIGITGHLTLIPIFVFWTLSSVYILRLLVHRKRGA
jgi:hypothetical protein